MKFINFTQHQLTDEQISAVRAEFAEIISVKNPSRFDDDGRENVAEIIDAIAREIVQMAQGEDAVVHFPISSPRVMAAFFDKKARVNADHQIWSFVANRCTFVFSYTRRIVAESVQHDGTVNKTSRFKFEKFLSY